MCSDLVLRDNVTGAVIQFHQKRKNVISLISLVVLGPKPNNYHFYSTLLVLLTGDLKDLKTLGQFVGSIINRGIERIMS